MQPCILKSNQKNCNEEREGEDELATEIIIVAKLHVHICGINKNVRILHK